MTPGPRRDEYDPIHRAILTGLLSSVALRGEGMQYTTAGGRKAILWPGSGVFGAKPKWAVAAEVVETTNRYLRCCARINPRWIEPLAEHLVHRTYSQVQWDRASASAMALEKVSLYGLVLVAGRRVRYGPVDPAASRELLIRDGLVEGQIDLRLEFLERNRRLLEDIQRMQAKLRRNDLVLPEWSRFEFYDRRIPEDVYDGPRLQKWLRGLGPQESQTLWMSRSDLVDEAAEAAQSHYPDSIEVADQPLPLEYRFEPGADDDGVTVTVPVELLGQVRAQDLGWGVPGLLEQRIVALIRTLPKELRRPLVPAPETAKKAVGLIEFGRGDFLAAVAQALSRVSAQAIPPSAFQEDKLPQELRMNVRVVDSSGQTLAAGRDVDHLRQDLGQQAAETIASLADPRWSREGIKTWDFDQLPERVEVRRRGLSVTAFPMLVESEEGISLALSDTPERASRETRGALRRLFLLAAGRDLKTQAQWLPNRQTMELRARTLEGFRFADAASELIADRATASDPSIPRTKAEFDRYVAAARQRIGLAVQDATGLLGPLLEAYHQARLALEHNRSPRWQYALDDVAAQLARLLPHRFLALTPWDWLVHFPRYLRAIPIRLDALRSGGLARDREQTEELQQRWQAYCERAALHERFAIDDLELARYRWMLEEYRVSLFAQRLGTAPARFGQTPRPAMGQDPDGVRVLVHISGGRCAKRLGAGRKRARLRGNRSLGRQAVSVT